MTLLLALAIAAGWSGAAPVRGADAGFVLTMSNASTGNNVLLWSRAADGGLTFVGKTPTGGIGTGGGLSNQGALALSADGEWLYVVNPGSDSLSVFRVVGTTLTRTDVEPSRGDGPISVAVHGTLVYVLNAGGRGNIRGFKRDVNGGLSFVVGSGHLLSRDNVQPVQIGFNPAGSRLVVTERQSDRITRFRVTSTGATEGPTWRASAGKEPFGFDFAPNGTLVVSEAGDHVNDGGSASSYRFASTGALNLISAATPTTETAACWTVVTPDGRFAYVTNTPDHSISGFSIATNGALAMLNADGRTSTTGAGSFPIDLDTSADGRFLYVLAAGTDRIAVRAIAADGSLSTRPGVTNLPGAASGIVAR